MDIMDIRYTKDFIKKVLENENYQDAVDKMDDSEKIALRDICGKCMKETAVIVDDNEQMIFNPDLNGNFMKEPQDVYPDYRKRLTIEYGGLTDEQLELYAKPEFDVFQKAEIKQGFKDGLSKEQVEIYAKPEFSDWQMEEIRKGFKEGLNTEQVKLFAKPEFDYSQMYEIKQGIKDAITKENQTVQEPAKDAFTQDLERRQAKSKGLER